MAPSEGDYRDLKRLSRNWGIPGKLPIFCETEFPLFDAPLLLTVRAEGAHFPVFYFGYDVWAPGFSTDRIVRVDNRQSGTLSITNNVGL